MLQPKTNQESSIQSDNPGQKDYSELERVFQLQKTAFLKNPLPDTEERIGHLKRLKKSLVKYKNEIADALNNDFSARCRDETFLAEIICAIEGINYNIRHVKKPLQTF